MDSSSISPCLGSPNGGHYFKEIRNLRKDLVSQLKLYYSLEDFNLFIIPSVTYAILALKHIMANEKKALVLGAHEHYLPIANMFGTYSSDKLNESSNYNLKLVTHVSPYSGKVNKLSSSEKTLEIVDASHSFATLLHNELINNSNIFIAPLHKHAGLAVGISIVAVRKMEETKFLQSSLEIFENSTSSKKPIIQAIHTIEENESKLYNIASIRIDLLNCDGVQVTSSKRNLPFICFKSINASTICRDQLKMMNASYFNHTGTFRISRWFRGSINSLPIDFSLDVEKNIKELI